MHYQVYRLKELFPTLKGNYDPTLTAYCPDNSPAIDPDRVRPTLLICPGGAYGGTSDREAEPVALRFVAAGFNAFVLRYSVSPERYPVSLLEAAASVAFIRSRAEEFHANPDQISIVGFSAGGHLAASLGVFWNNPMFSAVLELEPAAIRPNALILGYPVISSGSMAHRGSFENLLGKDAPQEQMEKLSLENQVNSATPPTFLWHTCADAGVPVENSLYFAAALRRHQIPLEMHIFPNGVHGLSLCDESTAKSDVQIDLHNANWMPLCIEWLKLFSKNV